MTGTTVLGLGLAALTSAAVVLGDATVPEVTDTIGTAGTLGIGSYLLVQIGSLRSRVTKWLDDLDKHHRSIEQHHRRNARTLRELVAVLRQAHGVPDSVVRDLTPVPEEPDELSPGRRRGVDPR